MARVVHLAWAAALTSLSLGALAASTAGASQTGTADTGIHRGIGGYLIDVAALSSTDVWAVGVYDPRAGGRRSLIEHWDGSNWSTTVLPPVGTSDALAAVSAVSPTDVWAVGRTNDGAAISTVVQHWDGAHWTRVDSPTPQGSAMFNDVFAVSSDDVWAVGASNPETSEWRECLIEHWDGVAWTEVPCPHRGLPTGNSLSSVSFSSATDGWAVGYYERSHGRHKPWTEHWDGKHWRWVEAEVPVGHDGKDLNAVACLDEDDVWVAGVHYLAGPFFEHWDGSRWAIVDSPSEDTVSSIRGLSAISTSDVWAVGVRTGKDGYAKPLVEHWDGTAWTVMPPSHAPGRETRLLGVSALSPDQVWAVGSKTRDPNVTHYRQLAGLWDGVSWRWY